MTTERVAAAITILSLLPLAALIVYLEASGQHEVGLYALVPFVGISAMQLIRSFVQGGR